MALLDEFGGVSVTFNVGDLSPYLEDDGFLDLRLNLFLPMDYSVILTYALDPSSFHPPSHNISIQAYISFHY